MSKIAAPTPKSISEGLNPRFLLSSAAIFLSLALLNYWPILIGKIPLPTDLIVMFPFWDTCCKALRTPLHHAEIGDLVTAFYPWRAFLGESIRTGVLPLWSPYELLGTPFLGNTQSAMFYPFNWLYILLPAGAAWSTGFILRTTLVGFMTSVFARSVGASFAGSTIAGIAYTFGAFTTVWQSQSLGDAALWLPLILFLTRHLWLCGKSASVGLLAIALSLPVLAGHPETAMHIVMASGAYATYLALTNLNRDTNPRRIAIFFGLFLCAGLLAGGIAAVQMLPTIEWLGQISRPLDFSWGSRPLRELVSFLSRDASANPNSAGVAIPEGATYIGILTLCLVPFVVSRSHRHTAVFFVILLFVSIQIIYGLQPFYGISQVLPILSGAKNYRLIGLASFSLAILAGLGLSVIQGWLASRQRDTGTVLWRIVVGSVLLFLLLIAAMRLFGPISGLPFDVLLRHPASSVVFGIACLILLAWGLIARPAPNAFALIAISTLCADLIGFSFGYIPFNSSSALYPDTPTYTFLKESADEYRMLPLGGIVTENFELMYGVVSATGYDNPLRRTEMLLRPLGFIAAKDQASAEKVVSIADRRLDLMNVKYLIATTYNNSSSVLETQPDRFPLVFSDGTVKVYENLSVLPRAILVSAHQVEIIPEEEAQLKRLGEPSFDPSASVILSDPLPIEVAQSLASSSDRAISGRASSLKLVEHGINDVSIIANISEPMILVLSQAYNPRWQVTVDGTQSKLLRVDYGLSGVQLSPGNQDIRFTYEPQSLRIGVWITIIALLLSLLLCTREVYNSYRYHKTQMRLSASEPRAEEMQVGRSV